MWGKLLIVLPLLLLVNCNITTTCDPTLDPQDAGCPTSQPICDPTGICRKLCNQNTDCPDPGTVCDISPGGSSSQLVAQICQTSCRTASDCQVGQLCITYTQNPPAGSPSTATPVVIQMCKARCPDGANSPPDNCVGPNFSCLSNSSQSYCSGTPASS